MAAGDLIKSEGTEIILETAASSAAIADGSYRECDSDDLQPADVAGKPLGTFELDLPSGFSADPTAGCTLALFEQAINSDGNDAPDVDANYEDRYLGTFTIDDAPATAGTAQYVHPMDAPINSTGGKYWLKWLDGGAGTAQVAAGWELRVTPFSWKVEV